MNKKETRIDSQYEVRVPLQSLKAMVIELLIANQLPGEQAESVADCFIEADVCGVSTHGVSILPTHIDKIRSGGYNLSPNFKVLREAGAFAVIDADNAIGAVSAVHCMRYAMKACKSSGIFTVFSRNCNTYGPAFYYVLKAAQQELIGITFCNSPAAMPAWNGKKKLFGTNPFAIAIPCKSEEPIIFDMATSKVAKSKINEARIKNEKIPLGWALDENGYPTDDPIEAINGLVLPMAEYKGYGLALTIDILSGVLSGAAYMSNVGKFYSEDNKCMNVGQTFIAMDPAQIYGEEYYGLMDEYVKAIRNSESIDGQSVSLPGDDRKSTKQDNLANGIRMQTATVEKLYNCFKDAGLNLKL